MTFPISRWSDGVALDVPLNASPLEDRHRPVLQEWGQGGPEGGHHGVEVVHPVGPDLHVVAAVVEGDGGADG